MLAGNVADIAMDGHNRHTDFTHLLLATGATDRVLPFAGWTVPGVFSLGGAQVALKSQGCAIGERVVFLRVRPASLSRRLAIHERGRKRRSRSRYRAFAS